MGGVLSRHTASGSGRVGSTRSRSLALLFVLCFGLLSTPSWADDTAASETPPPPGWDESILGSFDEEGRLHNETEKTYSLPDIGVFFGYFPKTDSLSTGMSVELFDRNHRRGVLNKIKWDLVIAEQRLGVSAGFKFIPVLDLTAMVFYTRDYNHDRYVWGLGLGLVKF